MLSLDELLQRSKTYSAFADHQHYLVTSTDLESVVEASQRLLASHQAVAVTIFDDFTGQRTDVEPEGGSQGVKTRFQLAQSEDKVGPGRPRLGVVSREVSLLPRHWEWLNAQSGGASAALRRLVDDARKRYPAQESARNARDGAAKAMTVLAGDQPGFEEALRALYADQFDKVTFLMAGWPADLQAHFRRVLGNAEDLRKSADRES